MNMQYPLPIEFLFNQGFGLSADFDEGKVRREHGRFASKGGSEDGSGQNGSGVPGSMAASPVPTMGDSVPAPIKAAADKKADGIIAGFTKALSAINHVPVLNWITKALSAVKTATGKFYGFLKERYGPKTAISIFASGQLAGWATTGIGLAMGVPLVIPGMSIIGSIPAMAAAEIWKQVSGKPDYSKTPAGIAEKAKADAASSAATTGEGKPTTNALDFDLEHWAEAAMYDLVANALGQERQEGQPFEGKNGRWFIVKDFGGKKRTVPHPAPKDASGAPRSSASKDERDEKAVSGAAQRIEEMRQAGKLSDRDKHELTGELLSLTIAQLNTLKKRIGLAGSGSKYELAAKLAARALARGDAALSESKKAAKTSAPKKTKPTKGEGDGQASGQVRGGGSDGTGGAGVDGQSGGDSGRVEGSASGPIDAPASAGQDAGAQPSGDRSSDSVPKRVVTATVSRVPAALGKVLSKIEKFQKFFNSRGQGMVADWLGKLHAHVSAVGTDKALADLGPSARATQGETNPVQYWGVGTEEANWKNMGSFIEGYLKRNGIIAVTGETSSPDSPLISALGAPDRYIVGQDFKPEGMHFTDKLTEAKTLPGLSASEDISVIAGKPVTHLSQDITAKLDERYGAGQWIVKCYDDNAAAGYGIFFPQRAAAIMSDARSTLWSAGENVARYGFELKRDDAGNVVGIKHKGGDEYLFGTEKYANTIHGDVRHWGDRAAQAAPNENGAKLPEGSFMAQPAFKAVGISDADRAAGKTWHETNEGRVHLLTKPDGSVEVVPHSTWLKGGQLPVVFENDDTRAMASAAKAAIEAIPYEARKGQVYAPDVMKTADGYSVVELNAQGDNNGSGYLHDNQFTIDSYVSHITGREPMHVGFIRSLLTERAKASEGGSAA